MNKFISFFILPLFIGITSYFVISLLSVFQLKNDYDDLSFIPGDSYFVVRVDAKDLGKDLLREWIQTGYKPDVSISKKDTLNLKTWSQFNSIDFSYPLYFFSKETEKKSVFVSVLSLKNEKSFLNSLPKDVDWSKFVFTHQSKAFIVSKCSDQTFNKVKDEVKKSNSTKWKKLVQSNELITFQTDYLNLSGNIEINKNECIFNGKFKNPTWFSSNSNYSLKPEGFHASTVIPLSNLTNLLGDVVPVKSMDLSWLGKFKSFSINYLGIKKPYTPQFQLLLNTREEIDVNEILSNFSFAELNYDRTRLSIMGMDFNFYQNDDKFVYIGTKAYDPKIVGQTSHLTLLEGDPKVLVNFDDAPLVKMMLLFNPQFASVNNFISKTNDFTFKIIPDKNSDQCDVKLKLEMEKSVFILTELFDVALNL